MHLNFKRFFTIGPSDEPILGPLLTSDDSNSSLDNSSRPTYHDFIVTSICDYTEIYSDIGYTNYTGPSVGSSFTNDITPAEYAEIKKKKAKVLGELVKKVSKYEGEVEGLSQNQNSENSFTQDFSKRPIDSKVNLYNAYDPVRVFNEVSHLRKIIDSHESKILRCEQLLAAAESRHQTFIEVSNSIFGFNIKGVFQIPKPGSILIGSTIAVSSFTLGYFMGESISSEQLDSLIPERIKKIIKVVTEISPSNNNLPEIK